VNQKQQRRKGNTLPAHFAFLALIIDQYYPLSGNRGIAEIGIIAHDRDDRAISPGAGIILRFKGGDFP